MKYKKYLLIFVIALFLGCNNTYAKKTVNTAGLNEDTCYYQSNDLKVYVKFSYTINSDGTIGGTVEGKRLNYDGNTKWKTIDVLNFNSKSKLPRITVNSDGNGKVQCPAYVIAYRRGIFALRTLNLSDSFEEVQSALGNNVYYAQNVSSKAFWGDLACEGDDCIYGQDYTITCSDLFDSASEDGESLSSLVNQVLSYVRIIVPILIILLGSLDFAKAVIASKEEDMKKAQATFVKRLAAGLVVFLVPTLVTIIMNLADIAWEGQGYTSCGVEYINK